jgi:PPOX class probable F420-dependent enzyme
MIDLTTKHGQRVAERLQEEQVIWLTTTGTDGTPQPRPVWFLWNGEDLLIYSQSNTAKLRHMAGQGRVALNFNSTFAGHDIGVMIGEASLVSEVPAAEIERYLNKYAQAIPEINYTRENFLEEYPVAIRVAPQTLRGF